MDRLQKAFDMALKEKRLHSSSPSFDRIPKVSIDLKNVSPYVVTLTRPHSVESEQYKKLKVRLFRPHSTEYKILLVTSPDAGAGKSLIALNLSILLALSDKVLLIDADLRHPSINKYLGIKVDCGLGDYFMGVLDLSKIIVKTDIGSLDILPSVDKINESANQFSTEKMRFLIESLKGHYSFIVIDSPPVLSSADAIQLASVSEAILLVINDRLTTKDSSRQALSLLNNCNILGAVFNNFPAHLMRIKYPYYYGR